MNYAFHCDQIIFFDRDKRQQSQTQKKIIFEIRILIINDERTFNISFSFIIIDNEYLLIEDFVREISSENVIN